MRRLIVAYGSDDFIVSSQQFPEEKMDELRSVFTPYSGDPDMVDVYHITDNVRDRVGSILGTTLKQDLYYTIETVE